MGIRFCGGNYTKKKNFGFFGKQIDRKEEDNHAQIERKEFWTFARLKLILGFGKLNYVRFRRTNSL